LPDPDFERPVDVGDSVRVAVDERDVDRDLLVVGQAGTKTTDESRRKHGPSKTGAQSNSPETIDGQSAREMPPSRCQRMNFGLRS